MGITAEINMELSRSSNFLNIAIELLRKGEKNEIDVDVDKRVESKDSKSFDKHNFLVCIKCKNPITQETNRIQVDEKHQHVFANPQGHVYQVGCFSRAQGCIIFGEKTSYFTWFPGYTWQIVLCSFCGSLLGWFFQSNKFHFFGLILDNIKNYNT